MKENAEKNAGALPSARNRCLDFFKGIAALCVVFVHIPFPGLPGKCLSAMGSCGVMLFFLISGYHAFGSPEQMRPKLKKRFLRNLLITLTALLVYFGVSCAEHRLFYHDFRPWIKTFAKARFWLRMFVPCDLEAIHGDPLWFMFALLEAYLIFRLMYRLRLQRLAKFVMPLFLLLRLVLETYKYAVGGDWRICSNVLVAAMPLMLLGYCIAEYRTKLLKIPAAVFAVTGIASLICLFLLLCYDPFRWNITQIFKLTAVLSAFLFAQKKPALRIVSPLCALGGPCSLHVYLWHMPVIVLMYLMLERRGKAARMYTVWYAPLVVAAISVVLAVLIVTVQQTGRKLMHRHRST